MRTPRFTPVDRLPLVGGCLCLDFVNTTGDRASERPRERLGSYTDLLVWAARARSLPRLDEVRLADLARRLPARAAEALERAWALRELLHGTFRACLAGEPPPTPALRELSALCEEAGRWRILEPAAPRLVWGWRPPERLDGVLWPVVADAAELLVSEAMGRVRQCGECDWLFLDSTRNRGRRWCKKACGDRVKARRYYARRRTARS